MNVPLVPRRQYTPAHNLWHQLRGNCPVSVTYWLSAVHQKDMHMGVFILQLYS